MLEIEVVQEAGHVNQFRVDGLAIDPSQRETEQIGAIGVLQHVR
jgi:hypothetical protein